MSPPCDTMIMSPLPSAMITPSGWHAMMTSSSPPCATQVEYFVDLARAEEAMHAVWKLVKVTTSSSRRLAWPGLAWPGLAWPGLASPGLAWPGLASPGLALPVLAWSDFSCPSIDWPGQAWPGPAMHT